MIFFAAKFTYINANYLNPIFDMDWKFGGQIFQGLQTNMQANVTRSEACEFLFEL